MKMNDLMNKPMKEIIEEMNVLDFKVITNNDCGVEKIIVEYEPKDKDNKYKDTF